MDFSKALSRSSDESQQLQRSTDDIFQLRSQWFRSNPISQFASTGLRLLFSKQRDHYEQGINFPLHMLDL